MQIKPLKVEYQIEKNYSYQPLQVYIHELDANVRSIELVLIQRNRTRVELSGEETVTADIVTRDGSLVKSGVACTFNEDRHIIVPIDSLGAVRAQSLYCEVNIVEGTSRLVLPFAIYYKTNASILDSAHVTPESEGTIPDLLREAVEALEAVRSYSNLTDKPTINGITVEGNLTSADFALRDGKSAYEIAVENGFSGTEQQWLQSLKGADGAQGAQGPQGAQGERGEKGDKGDKGDTGDTGTGIQGAAVNASGHLIVTLTDQTSIDCGAVRGADGVSVTNAEINASGHLILTLSSGSTIDAGYIGSPSIDISSATVTLSANSFVYDGTSKVPSVTAVTLSGSTLTAGTDYTVVSAPATNAGSYVITVSGIGDYSGTVTANWTITRAQATISGDSSISILGLGKTETATYTTSGDGAMSFSISDSSVATISSSAGQVTVTAVAAGNAVLTVSVAQGTNYLAATKNVAVSVEELPTSTVFGVMWDSSLSSPAITRLTPQSDPLSLVTHCPASEPSACVGTTGGSSEFDRYLPWNGMVRKNYVNGAVTDFTGYDNGETYVYIPGFWSKIVSDTATGKMYVYISSEEKEGFTKHPGSDRYVGRYQCDADFKSKPNGSPKASTALWQFRNGITAIDSRHFQYDIHTLSAVTLLYMVEWANLNSQAKIGAGITDGSVQNLGQTDILTYHTGRVSGTDNLSAVQYRWIENPYGNLWDWIDGVLIQASAVYICNEPANYSDSLTANYVNTGLNTPTGNNRFIESEQAYSNSYLFPKTASGSGSDSTYFCDTFYYNSGTRGLGAGGCNVNGSRAGIFFWGGSDEPGDSYARTGGRPILIIGGGS